MEVMCLTREKFYKVVERRELTCPQLKKPLGSSFGIGEGTKKGGRSMQNSMQNSMQDLYYPIRLQGMEEEVTLLTTI